jgi:hypothetical protein
MNRKKIIIIVSVLFVLLSSIGAGGFFFVNKSIKSNIMEELSKNNLITSEENVEVNLKEGKIVVNGIKPKGTPFDINNIMVNMSLKDMVLLGINKEYIPNNASIYVNGITIPLDIFKMFTTQEQWEAYTKFLSNNFGVKNKITVNAVSKYSISDGSDILLNIGIQIPLFLEYKFDLSVKDVPQEILSRTHKNSIDPKLVEKTKIDSVKVVIKDLGFINKIYSYIWKTEGEEYLKNIKIGFINNIRNSPYINLLKEKDVEAITKFIDKPSVIEVVLDFKSAKITDISKILVSNQEKYTITVNYK